MKKTKKTKKINLSDYEIKRPDLDPRYRDLCTRKTLIMFDATGKPEGVAVLMVWFNKEKGKPEFPPVMTGSLSRCQGMGVQQILQMSSEDPEALDGYGRREQLNGQKEPPPNSQEAEGMDVAGAVEVAGLRVKARAPGEKRACAIAPAS